MGFHRSPMIHLIHKGQKDMLTQPIVILHIEDNVDHAHLVKRTLQKREVTNQVYLVEDGQAALDYLFRRGPYAPEDRSPRPDLILLDLRLPKVTGLEVLRTIKETESLREIPVVVLTSSEANNDIAQAYAYRASSYLVKPVGFAKFNEMMRQLGQYWLGWNCYSWQLNGTPIACSRPKTSG